MNALTLSRAWRGAALAALLAAAPLAHASHAAPATLDAQLDELINVGDESPQASLAAIDKLAIAQAPAAATPKGQRALQVSAGLVAARNGFDTEATARVERLLSASKPVDALSEAGAHLIRAELEDTAGHSEAAYEQARAALRGYGPACESGPRQSAECDYRHWWRALQLAELGAVGQGNLVVAATYLQTLLEVARQAGDRPREAVSIAMSALLAQRNADQVSATRLLTQAQRLGRADGSPWLILRLAKYEGILCSLRGQFEGTQRVFEEALPLAHAAGLVRLEASMRTNLSDVYIRLGRPAQALAAIDKALPVVRRHNDLRAERILMHNATLARLALGRVSEAKADLARVLELWKRDTGPGERVEALREFGEALAKAGDAKGALELFHQEEALANEIRATNKAAAEQSLRAKYDQASQKRAIELLARDNQLKSAELDNQVITHRLWMLAGAAMALLVVLAFLMYLRMRELNRTLVKHEALLKAHSERDALTGLANRRQFREVMRVRGADRAFKGALMMVDVDHFKRINDRHGHAGGDKVLIEVARRLAAAVRGDDLVARWGGEEFLVFSPGVEGAELDQLADRVRQAVGNAAIEIDADKSLTATVSIGYASFPLPASHVPVTWEQAVNLADLSLYTAKNHGRNCAVGIVRTTAGSLDALREVEADLARAHEEGRVTLKVTPEVPAPSVLET